MLVPAQRAREENYLSGRSGDRTGELAVLTTRVHSNNAALTNFRCPERAFPIWRTVPNGVRRVPNIYPVDDRRRQVKDRDALRVGCALQQGPFVATEKGPNGLAWHGLTTARVNETHANILGKAGTRESAGTQRERNK